MSWDNQQPPWGQRKGGQSPEEQLAAMVKKIKDFFAGGGQGGGGERDSGGGQGPGINPGLIAGIIGVVLVGFILASSFYTIRPGEQGVVLRLGAYHATTYPGLNFKVPLLDVVHKVDMESVRKEQFGFRTRRVADRTQYQKQGYIQESLMLTSDRNVIDMEWVVQYRIADPVKFLHRVREPIDAIRDVSEAVVRAIVGNRLGSDVLTVGRVEVAATARAEMQEIIDSYDLGVAIMTVELQDVTPPDEVKPAFNEVNESRQQKERLINEAEKARNQVIPKARGEADQTIAEAEAYRAERVNRAKGEASRFESLVAEYQQAEETTRRRLYLEMVNRVFPNVDQVFIMGQSGISPLPLLDLQKQSTGGHRTEGGK